MPGRAPLWRVSPLARLLREPLVLFFVAGAFLFGFERAVAALGGRHDIQVPNSVRTAAQARLQSALGRAPNAAELRAAVEPWIREEALYREGIRLGLDQADPLIRERVIHKTLSTFQGTIAPHAIDDAGLERWFAVHAARYTPPTVYQVDVLTPHTAASQAELDQLLDELNQPAATASGSRGRLHRYRDAPESVLAQSYGASFVTTIRSAPASWWVRTDADQGPVLAKVHGVRTGATRNFLDIRDEVLNDWRRDQQREALEQRLKTLLQRYRIRYSSGETG